MCWMYWLSKISNDIIFAKQISLEKLGSQVKVIIEDKEESAGELSEDESEDISIEDSGREGII